MNKKLILVITVSLVLFCSVNALEQEYEVDGNTIVLYHFNEGSGNLTLDSVSGDYSTLNVVGLPFVDPIYPLPYWIEGKFGNSIRFDGYQRIETEKPFSNIDKEFTVEMWFKTNVSNQGGAFANGGTLYRYRAYYGDIYLMINNKYGEIEKEGITASLYTDSEGAVTTTYYFPQTYADNNWHHIAFTYNGSILKLYYDFNKVAEANGSIDVSFSDLGFNYHNIGHKGINIENETSIHYDGGVDNGFIGEIDELRISNVVRDFNQNFAPIIDSYTPTELSFIIGEGEYQIFNVNASDINNDSLNYNWKLYKHTPDLYLITESNSNSFTCPTNASALSGNYTLRFEVSDGNLMDSMEWNLTFYNIHPSIGGLAPSGGSVYSPIEIYLDNNYWIWRNSSGGYWMNYTGVNIQSVSNISDPERDNLIIDWYLIKNNNIIYNEHREENYNTSLSIHQTFFNYTFTEPGEYIINLTVDDDQYHPSPSRPARQKFIRVFQNDFWVNTDCIPNIISTNSTCQSDNTFVETFTDLNSCYENTYDELDIIPEPITHSCTYVAPSTPSSGGGSGGGGGSSSCSSKWTCNSWDECVLDENGVGKQNCLDWTDIKNCKNPKNKPTFQTQECVLQKLEQKETSETNKEPGMEDITGAVTGVEENESIIINGVKGIGAFIKNSFINLFKLIMRLF